ncbi:[protein-PII] uridylyltransferase [Orrella daihaiensis]|uniref:Bifunctional uridylyltransferase/uridylyl-removing enzyme n=1 Tax=Orrella daihaiensis TaxID=2782176 RepID=A0ABY4AJT8_9BURK|nr:[protein-PII] uridylyltransferase [Orrella daihaiensis]UOD49375.1 [protein-PII] uridylyltransferase [Orrella daihaiensis]
MNTSAELQKIRQTLKQKRDFAIAEFRRKPNAERFVHELRRATDEALRQLLRNYPLPKQAALAAVGGYGRGELYPYSDVDLLILLDKPPSAADEARLSELVAALWDLGIEPGYSVRTIDDCIKEAESDITVQTCLLETRFITGRRNLVNAFNKAMLDHLDPKAFYRAKLAEMRQRHVRYQETPYALEPNCKESPGGLRDLQVIRWMAKAAGFGTSWTQIAKSGLLTNQEANDLRRAESAFKRLRIELHLLAGRREDRLVFDMQHALANVYGLQATDTRRASEILMQRYYWAARLVTQLNTVLVQSIEESLFDVPDTAARQIDECFFDLNGRLDIHEPELFERHPDQMLRAFLVMQQHPELTAMTARTMRALWHARRLIDAEFRRKPCNKETFLAILQQPQGIVHALRRMTMLNILPRYLPVFRRVVGQMQHDLFHVYTVDQHTLQVIRNLRRFTMPEHAQEYPLASRLMASLERHWLLYVAALFHDIAKGRGGDHSELGAVEVRRFARDHGLSKDDTELVVFLVRQHLLMSQVAQKQDLSNPDVIQSFAKAVGTTRRLTALYLLTVADIRGTSPKVWNAWKGKLLEDLFHLAQSVLGGNAESANTVLQQRLQEATRLTRLVGLRDESREAFWNKLDVAYFLRHDAPDIAWHTRHLYYQVSPDSAVVKARPVIGGSGLQIMVYTHDQKDLFARICDYLGRKGLDVQDARIHTTRHGYALDSFVVLPINAQHDLRSLADLIEHELANTLGDDGLISAKSVNASTKRASRLSRAFPFAPVVELQPDEGSQHWRLAVVATDRPGLLADLAHTFTEFNVSLQMAKVMTLGERVEDVFVISGEVLTQPRQQRQFQRAIFETLSVELANAA